MKDEVDDDGGGTSSITVTTTKNVRFTSVVAAAGQPDVYVALFDPKQDPEFMRAVKQNRVLSVKQEPTSTRADFGVVGFDQAKFVTYLIFPQPLKDFVNSRIVGIKYDDVKFAPLAVTNRAPSTRRAAKPSRERPTTSSSPPKRAETVRPPAPRPRSPEPRPFQVHLRITTTQEKNISVSALTRSDAKRKAIALANNMNSNGHVKVTALKIVPSKQKAKTTQAM